MDHLLEFFLNNIINELLREFFNKAVPVKEPDGIQGSSSKARVETDNAIME